MFIKQLFTALNRLSQSVKRQASSIIPLLTTHYSLLTTKSRRSYSSLVASLPSPVSRLLSHQGFRTLLLTTAVIIGGLTLTITTQAALTGSGRTSCPNEQPITIPGVEKKLIRMGPSRTGDCVTPQVIIMHNTAGGTLDSNWQLFDENQRGGGQNAAFIIGENGKTYQTVELYQSMAELTWTSNYVNNYAVSIEMVGPYVHNSKDDQPADQYAMALNLVCGLMKQYNIPLGTTEYDWKSSTRSINDPNWVPGIYGHYQIVPGEKEDPGEGWLRDFRADLKAGNCGSSSVTSSGTGAGGRMVPYDKYARPYSWPMTGSIRQMYGFTEEAQSLGARFPGLYPIGDPNTVFSVTNHTEPPLDPTKSKYINPNIDIQPDGSSAGSRAVYATQAGWITFADWAGPEKGYTIQIESDVEGDGQSDLATRYMRLQAPVGGFFAPDIALFKPSSLGTTSTLNGACTSPQNNDWAEVNKWDEQVKQAITTAKTDNNVDVACNLIKALIMQESGGVDLPADSDGYLGLMQVGGSTSTGGGANCDLNRFDINTTQGNLDCGVQQLARNYTSCNNNWDAAIIKYVSGKCDNPDAATSEYRDDINQNLAYLNSDASQTPAPPLDNSTNPTVDNPVSTEVKIPPMQTIQAEDMRISEGQNVQTAVVDDGAASMGKAVLFRDQTILFQGVDKKADRLAIVAKATTNTFCPGNAVMRVSIDDGQTEDIEITSNIYKSYYIDPQSLDGSNHNIRIQLVNPTNQFLGITLPGCQRQLFVDSVNFIITNPNTPTVTTQSEVTIEVEDLSDVTEGDKKPTIVTDSEASNDQYVSFTSNGTYEGQISIPDSNHISIRARGDICGDDHSAVLPIISIKLNDQEVLALGISQRQWINYSTDLKLPTSEVAQDEQTNTDEDGYKSYTLSVEFTNDEDRTITCDINAFVDSITFINYQVNQTTTNQDSILGKTKYVAYNQLIGYVSNSRGTDAERAEYKFNPEQADQQNFYTTVGQVPNPSQAYLSYRIMYNNPHLTTFPQPDVADTFINAKVDNPYIVETDDNTVAGNLKTAQQEILSPMYFFCALRTTGNSVKCINTPNP